MIQILSHFHARYDLLIYLRKGLLYSSFNIKCFFDEQIYLQERNSTLNTSKTLAFTKGCSILWRKKSFVHYQNQKQLSFDITRSLLLISFVIKWLLITLKQQLLGENLLLQT